MGLVSPWIPPEKIAKITTSHVTVTILRWSRGGPPHQPPGRWRHKALLIADGRSAEVWPMRNEIFAGHQGCHVTVGGGGWNASGGCHGDKGQSSRRKGSPPERRSPGVPRWPPDGHLFLQLNLWKFVRIIKISTIFQWKSCWIVMNFWIFHQIGKPARLGGMDLNKFE